MKSVKTRIEKDSMGEMAVPEEALYGASTQRAVLNFPVSGYRFSRPFIRALGLIKWGAAQAIHVSAAEQLKDCLLPALEKLKSALSDKAKEFDHIIKIGRTHLMDATPVRLGQEFGGYAQQVEYGKVRAEKAIEVLRELARCET